MLSLLRITGFALIDTLELPLGSGFTVITGETGAGKSILIDALGLLRGGRATTDVIRTGREEATVEALWELPPSSAALQRLARDGRFEPDGAGSLVVRRLVARSGRGRAYLGASLATAGELTSVVGPLIDITSQHDQQSLMDPDSQLAMLDEYAGVADELLAMRRAYDAHRAAAGELASFDADVRTRAQREDLLKFQLRELDDAKLVPGEEDALRAERERVKGAERFFAVASRGEDVLYAGESAVAGQIAALARELGALAALDPTLAPVAERLREAQATVEDAGVELGRYASSIRFEPGRLDEIEERLFLISRLCRKHGGSLAEVIARRDELARALAEMGSFDEALAARRQVAEAARAAAEQVARQLSERRRAAARGLGRAIDETLRDLGLASAHVAVEVEHRAEDEALGPAGRDRVRFVFSPNPGEEPKPLARIASGGELSRVMLAVKRALARSDQATTYVFDEVDAGVGGGVAEVIGRKLKAISLDRQVIVVTHLPQIAAFADRHVQVGKTVSKGRTSTTIRVLDEAERTAELARMLGGAEPSREATAHASQMLRRARDAGQGAERLERKPKAAKATAKARPTQAAV